MSEWIRSACVGEPPAGPGWGLVLGLVLGELVGMGIERGVERGMWSGMHVGDRALHCPASRGIWAGSGNG